MTTSPALSSDWLAMVLGSLGRTGDEVARSLRRGGATGTPTDIWDDPVATYIRARTRARVAPDSLVAVMVTADDVAVSAISTSLDPDDYQEVLVETPGPVEDFIDRFDAGEDYQDLARRPLP
jgi:hypothetical protein